MKEHKGFQIVLGFFILFFTPPASVSVRRLWGPASRSSRPEGMWEGVAVLKERCRVDRNKSEHIKANFMTDLSPDAAFQRCKDDSWKAHYHRFLLLFVVSGYCLQVSYQARCTRKKKIYKPCPKKVMIVTKTRNIVQWTFERNEKWLLRYQSTENWIDLNQHKDRY